MKETAFPQYRRGIPKAGLEDMPQLGLAFIIAAIPFFFVQLATADTWWGPVAAGGVAYAVFRFVGVPLVRFVFDKLPPLAVQHSLKVLFYRGGLAARPDPDPVPFKVK